MIIKLPSRTPLKFLPSFVWDTFPSKIVKPIRRGSRSFSPCDSLKTHVSSHLLNSMSTLSILLSSLLRCCSPFSIQFHAAWIHFPESKDWSSSPTNWIVHVIGMGRPQGLYKYSMKTIRDLFDPFRYSDTLLLLNITLLKLETHDSFSHFSLVNTAKHNNDQPKKQKLISPVLSSTHLASPPFCIPLLFTEVMIRCRCTNQNTGKRLMIGIRL